VKAPPLVSDEDKEENRREFLKSPQAQSGDNDTEVKKTVDQEVTIEKPGNTLSKTNVRPKHQLSVLPQ
jgi:hypothetical protein